MKFLPFSREEDDFTALELLSMSKVSHDKFTNTVLEGGAPYDIVFLPYPISSPEFSGSSVSGRSPGRTIFTAEIVRFRFLCACLGDEKRKSSKSSRSQLLPGVNSAII